LTVKVELQLGNSLPPLLVGAATHSELEGNMYPLQTIGNMAKRNAGCELTPDFSAAAVIVRERAVGQANKSLPRVIQVREYCCHHSLGIVCMAVAESNSASSCLTGGCGYVRQRSPKVRWQHNS
jgi:hypothetical protein